MVFHIPRRGLRSLVVLSCMLLVPYMILRHVTAASHDEDSPTSTYSFLSRNLFGRSHLDDDYDEFDRRDSHRRDGTERKKMVIQKDGTLDVLGLKPKRPSRHKAMTSKANSPQHTFLDNGLLKVNPDGQHPIHDLLDRAQETWESKVNRASKTLRQAVNEYRRRYGRAPPKGFDRW